MNRLFSIQQVHQTILKSFIKDGHDPARPRTGVCCEVRDPAKLKDLVQYNKDLADRSPLMPLVEEDLLRYECLASTHYNVALRLCKEGRNSPSGDLAAAKAEDQTLAEAALKGHTWIVLPEHLADSLKADICQWMNQDQNENQTLTDGELVRMALAAVDDFVKSAGPGVAMPLHSITLAAILSSPLKINSAIMSSFCKWVCQMCEDHSLGLVREYLDFWSAKVDPRAMTLPHTFFQQLEKSPSLTGQGLVKMHLVMAQYTKDGLAERTPPNPSVCVAW